MTRHFFGLLAVWASTTLLALGQTTPLYTVTTIAGIGKLPYPGDGRAATSVALFEPYRVAYDRDGNLYFTETYYHRVFRVSTAGILSVVAGNGEPGYSGDNGPATAAAVGNPLGVAVDAAKNIYVGTESRIRKISPDGTIRTIAGTGETGYTGDGQLATSARIGDPFALVVDSSGNVYFADAPYNVVRKVASLGAISTVAGTGAAGDSGDNGPATAARLNQPEGLALDTTGNLYIADHGNNRVRRVRLEDGVIAAYAGNGVNGHSGDNELATKAQLNSPLGLAVTADGLYIVEENQGYIRRVNPSGLIYTVGTWVSGQLDIAASPAGYFAVSNYLDHMIRRMSPTGSFEPLAGYASTTAFGDGGPATAALLVDPVGIALDASGNVLVADFADERLRRFAPGGAISTYAGTGVFGYSGDNGPARDAALAQPTDLAVDSSGNVFVTCNTRIRRIDPSGRITTYAGTDRTGFSGDNGLATNAQICFPRGLAVDKDGVLYIADTFNHRLRRVDRAGIITTIAGTGDFGYLGNGVPATSARLNEPTGLAVDSSGNIYFADSRNHRVRKISAAGVITDFAGNGERGNDGDGGPASRARLDFPDGVVVDSAGNVFIASGLFVRRVSPSGVISTIAGSGSEAFTGDGDLATRAGMAPARLTIDSAGRIYVSDWSNRRIRRLDPVQIFASGALNGATFLPGAVAPGEILAVFGDLGPAELVRGSFDANGKLLTTLAELQITFDGVAAPLLYVSANQAGPIVPYSVAGKSSTVMQATYRGRKTNTVTLSVAESSPGIVSLAASGQGPGAILNEDATLNTASNPAARGSIIVFWATGEGQTKPAGVDGKLATDSFPVPLLPVSVTIGGLDAEVLYAGAAPFMVAGAMQVNARVPANAPTGGAVSVRLKVGNNTSREGVTVALR